MKFITTAILTFLLALGGLHLTSCQAFTKADAQALGAQIAKSSLAVAAKASAGERVDLKSAAVLIGLQAASSAIATVTYNLASVNETPQSIVSDAHAAAQSAITSAAVSDPELSAQAAEIATAAVAAAQDRLNAGAATSGK